MKRPTILSPPAIVIQADRFELLRCRCPVCRVLDARYPLEGFQLALFSYRASLRGTARWSA